MRIVGDVEFESTSQRASFITPVPGNNYLFLNLIIQLTCLRWSGANDSSDADEEHSLSCYCPAF